MECIDRYCDENVCKILVGYKKDLEEIREVPEDYGKKLADHFSMDYYETSAKEGINIQDPFINISR